MAWKQPIPTGLEVIFGDDPCQLLYRELIYRAANADGFFTDKRGKTTPIKRGQTVFGRNRYAMLMDWSAQKCERRLEKLQKTYKLVIKQTTPNFTLVELLNYDELVNFEQATEQAAIKQRSSSDQAMSTSKSVKNVKSVESERIITNSNELVPVEESTGYAKWNDKFQETLGFRITKKPKENENAIKAIAKDYGKESLAPVLEYLGWLKATKKAKERPYWYQYVTSFIKIREQWDNIMHSMTDDAFHKRQDDEYMADFFNR